MASRSAPEDCEGAACGYQNFVEPAVSRLTSSGMGINLVDLWSGGTQPDVWGPTPTVEPRHTQTYRNRRRRVPHPWVKSQDQPQIPKKIFRQPDGNPYFQTAI